MAPNSPSAASSSYPHTHNERKIKHGSFDSTWSPLGSRQATRRTTTGVAADGAKELATAATTSPVQGGGAPFALSPFLLVMLARLHTHQVPLHGMEADVPRV